LTSLSRTGTSHHLRLSAPAEATNFYQIELSAPAEATKSYQTVLSAPAEATKSYQTVLSAPAEAKCINKYPLYLSEYRELSLYHTQNGEKEKQMSIYVRNYRYHEVLSAASAVNEEIAEKHITDPLVVLLSDLLVKKEEELRASIAYHEQNSLAEKSDEVDGRFNDLYVPFRNVVEAMGIATGLGETSHYSAQVASVLKSHDRNLHNRSKDEQISLFDNIVTEVGHGTEDSIVAKAGFNQLFIPIVDTHLELKEIEKTRAANSSNAKDVPAPYEVAKAAQPIISKLHEHLSVMVQYGADESYSDTLNAVDSRLAPIVSRVKARLTRRENEAQ